VHFTGDLRALPEGSIFFAHEPILEVTAPIIQAQLLETHIINTIGLHTETFPDGKQLLEPVMQNGRVCRRVPDINEIRDRFASRFKRLPEACKQLSEPSRFPVKVSRELMSQQAGESIVTAS
jgi:nicotinic acid phosphoribosyltransferase